MQEMCRKRVVIVCTVRKPDLNASFRRSRKRAREWSDYDPRSTSNELHAALVELLPTALDELWCERWNGGITYREVGDELPVYR